MVLKCHGCYHQVWLLRVSQIEKVRFRGIEVQFSDISSTFCELGNHHGDIEMHTFSFLPLQRQRYRLWEFKRITNPFQLRSVVVVKKGFLEEVCFEQNPKLRVGFA